MREKRTMEQGKEFGSTDDRGGERSAMLNRENLRLKVTYERILKALRELTT